MPKNQPDVMFLSYLVQRFSIVVRFQVLQNLNKDNYRLSLHNEFQQV